MTKRFSDDELLALSLLQHIVFCERQCSLNSNEQLWFDNKLTVSGSQLHRRVHGEAPRREKRGDVVIVRELMLCSHILGVTGKADVVEFHKVPSAGVLIEGCDGFWQPYPVEYKHGTPKVDDCDMVQLCAQAICLEEMLGSEVPEGALFYGRIQKREQVVFNKELRLRTQDSAQKLHELVEGGCNPPAELRDCCNQCAMKDTCMPEVTGSSRRATNYIDRALRDQTE